MSLAGLCISRSGVDITLVTDQGGSLQTSERRPIVSGSNLDPIIANADSLTSTIASLATTYPRELTVLSVSAQLRPHHRDAFLRKAGLTVDRRFTITHIDAYIATLDDREVETEPCILVIEVTTKKYSGHLVTVRSDQGERVAYPLRTEGSTPSYPLNEFIHQIYTWAQRHKYNVSKCVLLDVSPEIIDRTLIQSSFASTTSLGVFTGADLSRFAALYAFKNIDTLRDPDEGIEDGEYETPAAISFSIGNADPQVIIAKDVMYPSFEEVVFETPIKQSRISVEFQLGSGSVSQNDGKFTFATIILDGLSSDIEPKFTVSASVDEETDFIEVFQGLDKEEAVARVLLQIPEPFYGRAWDAVKATEANK
ncbi:hypothetical protein CPB83DRAFT_884973 [Crepidotus variabilis]|uniref:Uncharacterized protein n=1 Tax=Crepidotus variabilis TaxID=179855 RepID=A0A9P6JN78_9AGAR|nr:hypothetical protein CPB83DRAFT_884973 [Crepidotus variabilis]